MRVGVIVAARGPVPFLAEALESVLSQDPGPDDVVVVDHASEPSLDAVDGVRLVSHGGSTIGQYSEFVMVPERGFAVISMTNCGPNGSLFNDELIKWALKEYLGVDVPDDAHGVLQDVHWSRNTFGYFPTYALGNVVSVQLWERIESDLGTLDEQFERGEFAPLREWLGDNVHALGRKFTPQETLRHAIGTTIDAKPYLAYLKRKYGAPVAA